MRAQTPTDARRGPALGQPRRRHRPGQAEVLETPGITEAFVGAPIRSTLETAELGRAALGFRVLCAQDALQADAVVLMNRVKPHTNFASAGLGSGILKMSAIGLGKVDGAFECHQASAAG